MSRSGRNDLGKKHMIKLQLGLALRALRFGDTKE
jgi:hypothetical protein